MQNASDLYKKAYAAEGLFIETVKGNRFYFDRPVFDIDEIAHALGNQCRYTGHCKFFYSVAEHSILTANIMERLELGDPFEGLMHDATEAYLSDIASPWKAMLPDYKVMEAALEAPMRAHFWLPSKITDGCKKADWLALYVECRTLIPSQGAGWVAPEGIKELAANLDPYQFKACGWGPEAARDRFLMAYRTRSVDRRFRTHRTLA